MPNITRIKKIRGVACPSYPKRADSRRTRHGQRLPLLQLILVGLQHVLLMYGGAVAVPLIIGQAAGLSREEIAFLINADLLVAGIATIVQSFGIGPMGIRMPVMMGASFAAVGSMVAMAGMPGIGLQGHLRGDHRRRVLRHAHCARSCPRSCVSSRRW